ncbi:hypothetical protein SAMN02910317_02299 [Ruminococcaceae bacterium FB2012]|nr:hypothetical protein SAMN02910317_02299 [Ruminococcaceae bacterium FB2012]
MTEQDFFKIRRNLSDAGLNETEIAECITLIEQNRYTELNRFLKKHRLSLLDSIHKYNARIDCLDYFTHTLDRS